MKSLRFAILAVLACVLFLLGTEPGLYTSLFIAKYYVPGELSFSGVHGRLLGDFSIEKLRYTDVFAQVDVQLEHVLCHWKPMAVFMKQWPVAAHVEATFILSDKKTYPVMMDMQATSTTLKIKSNILTLQGRYKPTWDLQWTLIMPKIMSQIGNFHTTGTIQGVSTHVTLTAKITGEAIKYQNMGLHLDHVNLEIKGNADMLQMTGKIVSGAHVLSLAGEAKAPFVETFFVTIIGKDFPVMYTNEYHIMMTPDVRVVWSGALNKLLINGTVDIPFARIQPLAFTQSLELPADVVFVSDKIKPSKSAVDVQIESRINVRLGDNVRTNTHGLTGQLTGAVMVINENNEPTTGEGELSIVNGVYNAYGQKLKISQGRVMFGGGAIDNPQVLIRATRAFDTTSNTSPVSNSTIPSATADMPTSMPPTQFNHMVVGIEITGYSDRPVIRLFSVPATLSQSDILSFLILGRPMTQASSADGALLLRALSALNIGGSESTQVTQQLKQTFGLDMFNVETHSAYDPTQNAVTNSTSLVIGKAVSSKLFVDYSIGLMQGTNILTVKYWLTPHWLLQTQTDASNEGVDLLYHFSRN